MKPFCSTRVHFQGNVCTRLCLLQLQQCSTTFSQAINLNVELHSTGCLSQPFFWCYLQSKRSKTLSVVRGSPRLLAYQPVIYVKILAKRESEGKKKGKASEESVLAERWHKEAAQQNPHATSALVHDPRKGACFSAPTLSGSDRLLPKFCSPHHPSATKPRTGASSTLAGREASLAGTWCQPTSSAGQGEATQGRGLCETLNFHVRHGLSGHPEWVTQK